jgi:O-antigen ligase
VGARGGSRCIVRSLVWWILLFVVALAAQSVVGAHRTRTRGLPDSFPAPVAGADVPILGVNVALEQYDDQEIQAALKRISEGGFVWVRQSFYWGHIQPEPDRFDWTVPDRILDALAHYPQLRLLAVLEDSPAVPPDDPDRFADFAGAFAARYGAQVDDYQVWDEPNLAANWGGGPVNPLAYADLLARTARAIRAADPEPRILLAGLAPTVETGPQNLGDARYLEQLYQAGAAPYFDVVAGKPYGFDTGPDDRRIDESVLNFSRLLLLREVMVEHGDSGKAIWASHWGWNALPPDWTGTPSLWGQVDEATQAARTVAALERARAEWPWAGALILEHFQPAAPPDDPRWGFALLGPHGAHRPVYDAVAAWATALPHAAPVGGYSAHNPWVTYEGDWRVGPMGADVGAEGDRAAFRFEGTSVALTVRRGPYRAFLYVTVDGAPATSLPKDEMGRAYVVLYDSAPAISTVPLATGLSPGLHIVEIVAERGQGQWVLEDWRVGAQPVRDGYGWKVVGLVAAGLVLVARLVRDARRAEWGALGRRFLDWPEWAQVSLAVGLTGLLWATAGASWGQDWDSPWCAISWLTLPALAALLALRLDLGLALVAFTAPFYLHPGAMLYQALSLPEVLVVLCGVGLIAKHRIWGSASLQSSPIDWAVLSLTVAAVAASLAAADWWAALFELRTVFLLPALYYLLLRLSRLDGRARWWIVDGFVLGAVGVAVIGLGQYALGRGVVFAEGGLPRLQSVYHSPNNVGLYLGRAWPLLVAVVLWQGRGRRRSFYGLALALVMLALGLSFSRGALLLGLPAALLVMGWRVGGRYRWAVLALAVVGLLALIPLLRLPRFASLLDLQTGSTFFRLELWRSSLTLIRERPWLGVGPGNFLGAYRTRYVLPSAWQEFNLEHPHNVYLDHWTRLGLLGLLAGGAVQVVFWREVRRGAKDRVLAFGLTGSMVAFLAHGLVDNTLFFPDLALVFFLTLGLVQGDENSPRRNCDEMAQ